MKRMSAPPSSINMAHVCRNRWHDPYLPMPAAVMYIATEADSCDGSSGSPRLVKNRIGSLIAGSRIGRTKARYRSTQVTARSPMGTTRSLRPFPCRTKEGPQDSVKIPDRQLSQFGSSDNGRVEDTSRMARSRRPSGSNRFGCRKTASDSA